MTQLIIINLSHNMCEFMNENRSNDCSNFTTTHHKTPDSNSVQNTTFLYH